MVTGSDLNVKGDLYNNVEGDVVYQAASGKGYERSSNKSSGYGVGVYADSKTKALPSMPIAPKAMAMVKQLAIPIAMSQSVALPIKTLVVILSYTKPNN